MNVNELTVADLQYRRQRAWYVNDAAKYGLGRMVRAARATLKDMFPAWTDLGGYTITYFTHDGSTICAECARKDYIDGEGRAQGDIYYEGPTMFCDGCNKQIESCYGDPDEDADEMKDLYLAR